jgi:hypothetical protein
MIKLIFFIKLKIMDGLIVLGVIGVMVLLHRKVKYKNRLR